MRKGFTLIEILILITTVPLLMVFTSRFFSTMISQTPRIWNNVQQNSTLLNMLWQMQQDIDRATDFPETKGDYASSGKLLLIEKPDTLIGYEFDDSQVVRRVLDGENTDTNATRTWEIPDVVIEWKVLRNKGKGYCLELHNHTEYQKSNGLENQMPNSHLFFIGAL